MKFELGQRVRHKISGFTGIITSRAECLNGCWRYVVEPDKVGKDGEMLKGWAIDEQEIEFIDNGIRGETKQTMTGGPRTEVDRD